LRVLVAGGSYAKSRAAASEWRAAGARVAVIPAKTAADAKRYAKAWDYDLLMWQTGKQAKLTRMKDGRSTAYPGEPNEALLSWARVGNES
jgi:hypothetical protein